MTEEDDEWNYGSEESSGTLSDEFISDEDDTINYSLLAKLSAGYDMRKAWL